ncbi:SET domain-containing protein-lysine N-methyltransferase [Candidatus Woesearchaeota archaeon]|nr:SET domain-containing protein-lysine N-methyltransferase [Candidatus Woesearchaeota archaeon]
MTLHPAAEAGKSPIDGKGIFAKKFISKGATLWRWGKIKRFSKRQFQKLGDAQKKKVLKYAFEDENGFLCLCLDNSRFINHSCSPNMAPSLSDERRDIAIRDIRPGEEITYDYAFLHPAGEKPMRCRCHSTNCRKLIRREVSNPPWMKRLKNLIRDAEKLKEKKRQ